MDTATIYDLIQQPRPDHPTKREYSLSDTGNAQRLYDRFGTDFRWVTERRSFIYWNNNAWAFDTPDNIHMMKLAKLVAIGIPNEVNEGMTDKKSKEYWAFAGTSLGLARQKAMIESVKSEGDVTVSANQLDADPYLFNCRNVTIELHTGIARPHSKKDYLTIVAPVDYDPKATCPKWDDFINLIMGGNKSLIKYLQAICGYCMTGDTKDKIIPFCHGPTGTGKTTFWGVERAIMGDYAKPADAEVFMSNSKFMDSDQKERMADMKGKRLVTCTEIPNNQELKTTLLKNVSGGEKGHGKRLYEHSIDFDIQFKVILAGNYNPIVKENSDAVWTRLKKIPFIVQIQKPVKGFESIYLGEMSGILNWNLAGCLSWQKEGLIEPNVVTQTTDEYREDQDNVLKFINSECVKGPKYRVTKTAFKERYISFCTETSSTPLELVPLKQAMLANGYTEKRHDEGICWVGLRLRDLTDQQPCDKLPCNTCEFWVRSPADNVFGCTNPERQGK